MTYRIALPLFVSLFTCASAIAEPPAAKDAEEGFVPI